MYNLMNFDVEELCPQSPPSAVDKNKSTKTWSAWGGKVAELSKERGQEPVPQWAFIGFNLHRNEGSVCVCVCVYEKLNHCYQEVIIEQ